jgi:hypothetical protein
VPHEDDDPMPVAGSTRARSPGVQAARRSPLTPVRVEQAADDVRPAYRQQDVLLSCTCACSSMQLTPKAEGQGCRCRTRADGGTALMVAHADEIGTSTFRCYQDAGPCSPRCKYHYEGAHHAAMHVHVCSCVFPHACVRIYMPGGRSYGALARVPTDTKISTTSTSTSLHLSVSATVTHTSAINHYYDYTSFDADEDGRRRRAELMSQLR